METALTLEMRPVASPALLAFTGMLALSSAQVEGLVAEELLANPALERTDVPACPLCGSGEASCCRVAAAKQDGNGWDGARPATVEWAAPRTDAQELLDEIRCCATPGETALAGYLIDSLDDRGFLPGGPEQVADDLGIALASVNRVLELIRYVGPPAIGARDVRESLLLQLAAMNLAAMNPHEPLRGLAIAIADRHLHLLAAGRLDAIAAALGVSREEIAVSVRYVREHCVPSPAPGLRGPAAAVRLPAVPDVVITVGGRGTGGLHVEMMEPARLSLRIHPDYERFAATGAGYCVRGHAAGLVRRAASFMSQLDARFQTIRQVVEHAADHQRAFVVGGPRYLRPLAQSDVARDLGIHESTVSRAVAGKYMMLPSRAVVPVQDFFRPSLAPQDALRALIAAEKHPLTDTELSRRLQAQGFRVARRTVAKYRHALGVAAAPLR